MNKMVIIADRRLTILSEPGIRGSILADFDYRIRKPMQVVLTNNNDQSVTLQWSEGQMSWFCGTVRIKTNIYNLERLVNGLL
jgi:hypothetical protein